MKITKIVPRGFCSGVVDSWIEIKKFIKENPKKKFFMIGWFVHNKFMVKEIEDLGVKIIDDSRKSRYEIISNLEWKKNTVLIFSAHGTDEKVFELAKKRNFEILDCTCFYVEKIHEIIKKKIAENKKILFYGLKKHPESVAISAIDYKNISVCENISDVETFLKENIGSQFFFTNQTTICLNDYFHIIQFLKENNSIDVEIQNDICPATLERQEAIKKLKGVDLLIVVGDSKSNNSKNLKKIGIDCSIDSVLVSNYLEIDEKIFKGKKHVAITSGASTPTWITKKVIDYVESKKRL